MVLECIFSNKTFGSSAGYTCEAHNFQTTLNDRVVTEIKGEHKYKYSNENVTHFFIYKQSCSYLPLNLSSFFKNIEFYQVKESRLGHLVPGDFDGFTNLKTLDLSHNPIEELRENVFDNESSIESLSFYNCHLKIIDTNILDSLWNLKKVNFQSNLCISQKMDPSDYKTDEKKIEKLESLKTNFHEKCQRYSHNKAVLHQFSDVEQDLSESDEINEDRSLIHKYAIEIVSCLVLIAVASLCGMIFFAVRARRNSAYQVYRYSGRSEEAEEVLEKLEF